MEQLEFSFVAGLTPSVEYAIKQILFDNMDKFDYQAAARHWLGNHIKYGEAFKKITLWDGQYTFSDYLSGLMNSSKIFADAARNAKEKLGDAYESGPEPKEWIPIGERFHVDSLDV